MKVQSCSWAAAVALALGLTLSGCTIGAPALGETPSKADRKKDRKHAAAARKRKAQAAAAPEKGKAATAPEPAPRPKPKARVEVAKKKAAPKQVWVCSWAPTVDEDRHNDVLCDNGIASERPRLREWDDQVERWEMMESAREYAFQRNAA